jgi:hypothetical protein
LITQLFASFLESLIKLIILRPVAHLGIKLSGVFAKQLYKQILTILSRHKKEKKKDKDKERSRDERERSTSKKKRSKDKEKERERKSESDKDVKVSIQAGVLTPWCCCCCLTKKCFSFEEAYFPILLVKAGDSGL